MITKTDAEKKCLALRGDLFPLSVVEITQSDLNHFDKDLLNLVKQAPNFFQNTPIVLDLHKISELNLPLSEIRTILQKNNLILVGLRGANETLRKEGLQQGIASLNKFRQHEPTLATRQVKTETIIKNADNKIIDKPVRSGQQCYARNGDLIILSSVSEGAEVLADGNIHIYGTLRGRALAGAQGDKKARIFLHKSDAELISIAGTYTTILSELKTEQPTQIMLVEDKLIFSDL